MVKELADKIEKSTNRAVDTDIKVIGLNLYIPVLDTSKYTIILPLLRSGLLLVFHELRAAKCTNSAIKYRCLLRARKKKIHTRIRRV